MYPKQNRKLMLGRGVRLALAAGCVISWIGVIHSWSRPARQYGSPPAAAAARFLQNSTWGPTSDLISHVQTVGYNQFLQEQFSATISDYPTLPLVPSPPPSIVRQTQPAGGTITRYIRFKQDSSQTRCTATISCASESRSLCIKSLWLEV